MDSSLGIPLLSENYGGESFSDRAESSCRRCDKEFNILFSRPRRCAHCGYAYCSSCSDYQALVPRTANDGQPGFDPVNVCAFCIEMLNITAAGRVRLKSMPVSKLRAYTQAYNIKVGNVWEKDDLIDIVINARERNGCLPRANENYYRRHSVPNRTTERPSATERARQFFNRATGAAEIPPQPTRSSAPPPVPPPRAASTPPRPQPPPRTQSPQYGPQFQPQYQPRYHPPPRFYPPGYGPQVNPSFPHSHGPPPPPPPQHTRPPRPPPQQTRPTHPRPTATAPSPPAPPTPTLDQLLNYTNDEVSKLPVHSLKDILFSNHVNARWAVEKSELIERVNMLIGQERSERAAARQRQEDEEREMRERAEREDQERIRLQQLMMEEKRRRDEAAKEEKQNSDADEDGASPPAVSASASKDSHSHSSGMQERFGLCVVCQDEDANIAIVDCGHLCLCRACSDIVMKSTRECPMCRTRIVTESRLLRVFKT